MQTILSYKRYTQLSLGTVNMHKLSLGNDVNIFLWVLSWCRQFSLDNDVGNYLYYTLLVLLSWCIAHFDCHVGLGAHMIARVAETTRRLAKKIRSYCRLIHMILPHKFTAGLTTTFTIKNDSKCVDYRGKR